MELDTIVCMDALDFLRGLPDGSIQLIATDPPYNGVKDSAWDNQWPDDATYLDWLRLHLLEMRRVLAPNGSLYLFASPRMAARVEVLVGEYFNVLNSIVWHKQNGNTNWKTDKSAIRSFLPNTERIIFAEQSGADSSYQEALIGENTTYWQACATLKVGIIGDYLQTEFNRAGVSRKAIAALFPSKNGRVTGCVSNWLLGYNIPTPEQYQKMREYLNLKAGSSDYLRREYEDLRREYEDLRRPFNSHEYAPYTDVWTYRTVQAYLGKHECEKPLAMMKDIVAISSRPDDVVLDCFCGSGPTLDAARQLDRRYIGCDRDPHCAAYAQRRLTQDYMKPLFANPSADER